MAQYMDDISLNLLREESNIYHAIYTLEAFYLGSSLVLNLNKSNRY